MKLMSCVGLGLLVAVSTLQAQSTRQPSNTAVRSGTSTSAPIQDPQALEIVQAAITALGGSQALSGTHTWTFQAHMEGPLANGNVNYPITVNSTGTEDAVVQARNGKQWTAPPVHSLFVPFVLGSVLVDQTQNTQFSIRYLGLSNQGTTSAEVVTFIPAADPNSLPQLWHFDTKTSLPTSVSFGSPAELGSTISVPGQTLLSDYRPISGVLYPFRVVINLAGKGPEVITLQWVGTTTTTEHAFNALGGDTQ